MANSYVLQVSNYGKRKSISLDYFLFDLLSAREGCIDYANKKLRLIAIENWGSSTLSNVVQREVLKLVSDSKLLDKVLNTDFFSQHKIDFD